MNANTPHMVGIGEILWDHFPSGVRLGGCPTNFVTHAHALGAEVVLVSAVGADAGGQAFFAEWAARRLPADYIAQYAEHATGIIDITLDASGVPTFALREAPASDFLQWTSTLATLAAQTDAVFFGTFGQWNDSAHRTTQQFVAATPSHCLRVLDVNLRPGRLSSARILAALEQASVLKLNEEELEVVAKSIGLSGTTEHRLAHLCERFALQLIALTRGPRGALLFTRDGTQHDHPGYPVPVVDTVGAGDAFSAALTVGLLHQLPLAQCNDLANRAASYLCTQPGATAVLPESLRPNGRIIAGRGTLQPKDRSV